MRQGILGSVGRKMSAGILGKQILNGEVQVPRLFVYDGLRRIDRFAEPVPELGERVRAEPQSRQLPPNVEVR